MKCGICGSTEGPMDGLWEDGHGKYHNLACIAELLRQVEACREALEDAIADYIGERFTDDDTPWLAKARAVLASLPKKGA